MKHQVLLMRCRLLSMREHWSEDIARDQFVKRLAHTGQCDWKHSRKLDLSDEAVKADLEKHGIRP